MRLALALAAMLIATPAFACSCVRMVTADAQRLSNDEPLPTKKELSENKLVTFLGEVVKVRAIQPGDPSETTFVVLGHWEAELPVEVVVRSGWTGGGCGFLFEAGKRYVVFATRQKDDTLYTSICTRTTLDDKVPDLLDAIIAVMGPAKEPLVKRR